MSRLDQAIALSLCATACSPSILLDVILSSGAAGARDRTTASAGDELYKNARTADIRAGPCDCTNIAHLVRSLAELRSAQDDSGEEFTIT